MILMSIILKRNREIDIYIYNKRKGKERIREKKRDIIITTYLLPPSPTPQKKPILKLSCVICLHYIKELQELKIRNISK